MQYLWSPWRMEFIKNLRKEKGCVFCKIKNQKSRPPREPSLARRGGRAKIKNGVAGFSPRQLLLYLGKHCFIMMNRYPYNNGHLMIAPYKHEGSLAKLSKAELLEMIELTAASIEILKKRLGCDGANCGLNIGKVAGAGIADHVHMHVVPRWQGDANFMPIIADTKSMPEYLAETWKKLKPGFDQLINNQ